VDEAQFFQEHGWIALRGVVSPERAAALAEELRRVFPESEAFSERVHERHGIGALSPLLAEQVRDADLAARVAALLGAKCVQLLQDTALVKPPLSPARVEWHQDHTYTGFIAECVSVRLALTACTRESGCLRVLDKSHHAGARGGLRALSALEVSDDSLHMPEGEVVHVELQPGDVSVHHCLTFHSSDENRSAAARLTLIARVFDARQKLLRERLPPGLARWFPTDASGHLTGDAFPLL
jgi:ectoine hydroxylase-related dioxygenase (phytanoyl-CoA dioxygenase family)